MTSAVTIDCAMPPFRDITLIPMSTLLMLSTFPSLKKQYVVVPVSITSTICFGGTISRVVLTFNFLVLTTLDTDALLPQFVGPGPQVFRPDPQV